MRRFRRIGVVDNKQVPREGGGGGQGFRRAEHEVLVGGRRGRVRGVEHPHGQMEPPDQFVVPATGQRGRHHDQGALEARGDQEPVQHEAGDDGFSGPAFIGQDQPGDALAADLEGGKQLMRDQFDAGPEKPALMPPQGFEAVVQPLRAQVEQAFVVELGIEQTVIRAGEIQRVGEGAFSDLAATAAIGDHATRFHDLFHHQGAPVVAFDLAAFVENHAGQRRTARGILAGVPGGGKEQGDASLGGRNYQSEAQFGFIITQPPLSGNKRICHHSRLRS